MTYNQFQKEVARIWRESTDAGFQVLHTELGVSETLHRYHWEIGKIEIEGGTRQQQVAAAWNFFKKDFPQLVTK